MRNFKQYIFNFKFVDSFARTSISMLLVFLMLFTSGVIQIISYAAESSKPIDITSVDFIRNYDMNYKSSGADIVIVGYGLLGRSVKFGTDRINAGEIQYGGYKEIGTVVSGADDYTVQYTFNADEAAHLNGKIKVESVTIDLGLNDFPDINNIEKKDINVSSYNKPPLMNNNNILKLEGSKFSTMTADGIKAEYGDPQKQEEIIIRTGTVGGLPVPPNANAELTLGTEFEYITMEKPETNGSMGTKFIRFTHNNKSVDRVKIVPPPNGYTPPPPWNPINTVPIPVNITYVYNNAFRFIQDLGVDNVVMYPKKGAPEETVYFKGDNFEETTDYYQVYFLEKLTDEYSDSNRGLNPVVLKGEGTDPDRLMVKVPNVTGKHYVVITHSLGDEVISEYIVKNKLGENDQFTVIGSPYEATITEITEDFGWDIGDESVKIKGKNILSLEMGDLDGLDNLATPPAGMINPHLENDDRTLHVEYDGMTYLGKDVKVTREITAQIGKPVKFEKQNGEVRYIKKDTEDTIYVITSSVTDAQIDPKKDVVMEIKTTIEELDGTHEKYIFDQKIIKRDGFRFIPSSLAPTINDADDDERGVNPHLIQIKRTFIKWQGNPPEIPFYNFADDTLLSIKGENFMVSRVANDQGEIFTYYPSVLIKKDKKISNETPDNYQLAFLPNKIHNGVRGIIKYKKNEDGDSEVLMDNGAIVPCKIVVLNEENEVVDGTENNNIGVKILITIPKNALIKDDDLKGVQVVNPSLKIDDENDDNYGKWDIKNEIVKFVVADDSPAITSVKPQITTVEGGIEILITGKNFKRNTNINKRTRLFLDGEEIELDVDDIDKTEDGNQDTIRFIAPAGREGTTQLQLVNPKGGIAVRNFTYVGSFSKKPEIEDFNPKRGSNGTLVVIRGDNYSKPDPTVSVTNGYGGLKLIGTRVFIDGKDVNDYEYDSYGEIKFNQYTYPQNEPVLRTQLKKAIYSPFYKNAYVKMDRNINIINSKDPANPTNESVTKYSFKLGFDEYKNPRITDGREEWFDIRRNSADTDYEVYDMEGKLINGSNITFAGDNTIISFNQNIVENLVDENDAAYTITKNLSTTFTIKMDNKILRTSPNLMGALKAELSDYYSSVTLKLKDEPTYYILSKNFQDQIELSNGKGDKYIIEYDKFDKTDPNAINEFIAYIVDDENKYVGKKRIDLTSNNSIKVGDKILEFITPYKVDSDNNQIIGDKTEVISKNRIMFRVPRCEGIGFKDIKVVNPDTKFDEKLDEDGFEYITQPDADPVITRIFPNKSAVEGGSVTYIYGYDFFEEVKVFIDGVEVPEDDLTLSLDHKSIEVVVPAYTRDLQKLKTDHIDVSVVVQNKDGSTASVPKGFRYFLPVAKVEISKIKPVAGSSTGGEIVEVWGTGFRYFEPFKDRYDENGNVIGSEFIYDEGTATEQGDDYEDLNGNDKWDDLGALDKQSDEYNKLKVKLVNPVEEYQYVLKSEILPTVYFGNTAGQILQFSAKKMFVLTPKHLSGKVDVSVVNNDLSISNRVPFTFTKSRPTITRIYPNKGKKSGMETRTIEGTEFYPSKVWGYKDDVDDNIVVLDDIQALVRFGDIDNTKIEREDDNSGLIYDQRTTVNLIENLKVKYNGVDDTLWFNIEENGKVYSRKFNNYNDEDIYVPIEMLKSGEEYYRPSGYLSSDIPLNTYSGKVFEHIRVYIQDGRMFVERGYVPKSSYNKSTNIEVITPSYYTIDPVNVRVINPDTGDAKAIFNYTYPDSAPKILTVGPHSLSPDKKYWMVEGAMNGNIEIEIIGRDFRKGIKVKVGERPAIVREITTKNIEGVDYDVLIVNVAKGTESDIGEKYPVIVENEDQGIASSATIENLIGPNNGNDTLPFYFVYRKPLSGPMVESVEPNKTSVFGGHEILIHGKDFRKGVIVIIGTVGGVPITNGIVEEQGRLIRLVTPKNMIVGLKAVVVQNVDFGQFILENGIQIVSYPKVEEISSDEGGGLDWLSVEGGNTIILKGEGFQKGAKVIFDGERSEYDEKKDKDKQGEIGLWKDDKYYIIENGYLSPSVEFIDDKTLKVTNPPIDKEDEVYVTVLNPDSGISDGDITVKYSEPVPSVPIGLKAKIVDETFIKLYGYHAKDVEYYEIFYNISSARMIDLKKDNYAAFSYLVATEREPYKISKLPDFKRAKKNDRIHFVIRAVNKFGPSRYSNIAIITYDQFKDIEEIGPKDEDGGLGVPKSDTHRVIIQNGEPLIELGTENIPPKLSIDLKNDDFDIYSKRLINVPAKLIKDGHNVIFVDYGDMQLQFSTVALNTKPFREISREIPSYGNVMTKFIKGDYAQLLINSVPRGKKAISPVLKLGFGAVNNEVQKNVRYLNSPIDIALPFSATSNDKVGLYKYSFGKWTKYDSILNLESGVFNKHKHPAKFPVPPVQDNSRVSLRTDEAGYFVIMKDR